MSQDLQLNDQNPSTILVWVVTHSSMALERTAGGARITITDVASGRIFASGSQQRETGDHNQIMRTPLPMKEPLYSSHASASFTASLELTKPTLADIIADGPLAYPAVVQNANELSWFIQPAMTCQRRNRTFPVWVRRADRTPKTECAADRHGQRNAPGLNSDSTRSTGMAPWQLGFSKDFHLRELFIDDRVLERL